MCASKFLCINLSVCRDLTNKHRVLASITEKIHAASLIHDDIVDDADVRRGRALLSAVTLIWAWFQGHGRKVYADGTYVRVGLIQILGGQRILWLYSPSVSISRSCILLNLFLWLFWLSRWSCKLQVYDCIQPCSTVVSYPAGETGWQHILACAVLKQGISSANVSVCCIPYVSSPSMHTIF